MADLFEIGQAKLAAAHGNPEAAVRHLGRAIDLGYRRPAELDSPLWDPVRDDLGFIQERARLATLIDEERARIIDMLCGPDAIMTWRDPAPATCAAA